MGVTPIIHAGAASAATGCTNQPADQVNPDWVYSNQNRPLCQLNLNGIIPLFYVTPKWNATTHNTEAPVETQMNGYVKEYGGHGFAFFIDQLPPNDPSYVCNLYHYAVNTENAGVVEMNPGAPAGTICNAHVANMYITNAYTALPSYYNTEMLTVAGRSC